jgi:N-methylhydantoinase B
LVVANPVTGGSAGGPDRDGISGTDFSVAFLRNVPVEVLESEVPVLVHRYSLVPDSEGAGQFRGGFGVAYDVEIRHPSAVVVMRGKDRFRFGSWGAFGGGGGAVNGNIGQRGDAVHDIGKRTVYRPEMGEIIRLWSGGGGGYGDPLTRDPALVARDVADDLISLGRAHGVYGVVMCDGAVDVAATKRHREQLATTRDAPAAYDFGPGRTEWERIHGAAAELIAAWMPSLPAGVRRYAQARVYRYLHEAGPGPYDAVAVQPILQRLETELSSPR